MCKRFRAIMTDLVGKISGRKNGSGMMRLSVREKFPQRVLGAISNCTKLVWRLGDFLGWCFNFTLVLSL